MTYSRFAAALYLSVVFATSAFAQHSDYAREKRFAQEVSAQLLVGDIVQISHAANSAQRELPSFMAVYAIGKTQRPAIVLAHGVGMHPDDGLTGQLRQRLNDLGYTTLAIQMPIAAREAQLEDYFPKLFPEASARLHSAAQWLRDKGHTRIALVSHTMGAWMANVYFDEQLKRGGDSKASAYQAWVCISLTGGYSNATRNYPFPILDLYGEQDIPITVSSAGRRAGTMRLAAEGSAQVKIEGADAQWRSKEGAAAQAIDGFIQRVLP
jgi:triacylglycerol esterase/lipase EstA (alpha/beta hydrolase family)